MNILGRHDRKCENIYAIMRNGDYVSKYIWKSASRTREDVPDEELAEIQLQYDAMDRKARSLIIRYLGPYALNIIRAHRASAFTI